MKEIIICHQDDRPSGPPTRRSIAKVPVLDASDPEQMSVAANNLRNELEAERNLSETFNQEKQAADCSEGFLSWIIRK